MKFNLYNLFGLVIVMLIIIPQYLYNKKHPQVNHVTNKFFYYAEKIGTYGCYALMVLPIMVGEFKFATNYEMLGYLLGTIVLIVSYLVFWIAHVRQATIETTMVFVYTQIGIYFLDGFMLCHWLLLAFSIIYAIGACYCKQYNYFYGKQRSY